MIKIDEFIAPTNFKRVQACADRHETPFVVIDLDSIAHAYDDLKNAFPYGTVYFAVKANPAIEITELLRDKGSCFDIASVFELDKVLSTGVTPDRVSFGNTIKKSRHIKYFYEKGVRMFATDCESDLVNIAQNAPGSKVYCRILVDEEFSASADWPLSKKFGCHISMARSLLIQCLDLGLTPYGVSFHVGSQQKSTTAWNMVLAQIADLYKEMKEVHNAKLELLNMGGGLPANYVSRVASLSDYSAQITSALNTYFPGELRPSTIVFEPGRSLVGNSGVLVSEVMMVSRKGGKGLKDCDVEYRKQAANYQEAVAASGEKWVYIDCGKFGGLIETTDECIRYPIVAQSVTMRNSVAKTAAGNFCELKETPIVALCSYKDGMEDPAALESIIPFPAAHAETPTSFVSTTVPSDLASVDSPPPSSTAIISPSVIPTYPPEISSFNTTNPYTNAAVSFATRAREPVILAGPTCDSADIIYKEAQYRLPLGLVPGDRLWFLSTGAYTTSYSSVEFNGFPALRTIILQKDEAEFQKQQQ